MLLFLFENSKVLSYANIQLLSPLKPQVPKRIYLVILIWSIMLCYANFIGDK